MPVGSLVYCASSNAVKRDYRHDRPKPGLYLVRREMDVELTVGEASVVAVGRSSGVEAPSRQRPWSAA